MVNHQISLQNELLIQTQITPMVKLKHQRRSDFQSHNKRLSSHTIPTDCNSPPGPTLHTSPFHRRSYQY